jgi:hypothetical protein
MAAALRHAGRTEHATRCCGRTGRSGSHQAAVRGLPGRVASARSGGGWQPSGHDAIGGMRHRQQCAPSRYRARTRRSETRRPDDACSRSVIGAPPDRSAHSRRYGRRPWPLAWPSMPRLNRRYVVPVVGRLCAHRRVRVVSRRGRRDGSAACWFRFPGESSTKLRVLACRCLPASAAVIGSGRVWCIAPGSAPQCRVSSRTCVACHS